MAFIIWNLCTYESIIEKTIDIPVYMQQPHTNIHPDTVQVTLRGKQACMRTIDKQSLFIHINEESQKTSQWVSITESDISLPDNVHMVHCHPSTIMITA